MNLFLYQFVFKRTTQPSAGYPGRQRGTPPARRVPGRTQTYVEESDAATTKVYA